jgi:predicted ATP-grasp superfamily ATP-dependent carboligase
MDKQLMREKLNTANLSKIELYNNEVSICDSMFPLVKKPRNDGMGGQGVEIFFTMEEYKNASATNTMDPKFVYEEFIEGPELAIDAIWDGKKVKFINLGWTLFHSQLGVPIGSTSQDDEEIEQLKPDIIVAIESICRAFCLGPEVLNIDAVLSKDKELHVIEFEFVPADVIHHSSKCFNYSIIDNFINCHLSLNIDNQPKRINNSYYFADLFNQQETNKTSKVNSKVVIVNPIPYNSSFGFVEVNKFILYGSRTLSHLKTFINCNYPQILLRRPLSE